MTVSPDTEAKTGWTWVRSLLVSCEGKIRTQSLSFPIRHTTLWGEGYPCQLPAKMFAEAELPSALTSPLHFLWSGAPIMAPSQGGEGKDSSPAL